MSSLKCNANLILTGLINDWLVGEALHWIATVREQFTNDATLLLTIDTGGGLVGPARALHNVLAALPCDVNTFTIGRCDSAGLLLFAAGSQRTAVPNATFLFHPVARTYASARMSPAELRTEAEMIAAEQEWIAEGVATAVGKPASEIEGLMAAGRVLRASEAQDLGLVTNIDLADVPSPPIWCRLTGT